MKRTLKRFFTVLFTVAILLGVAPLNKTVKMNLNFGLFNFETKAYAEEDEIKTTGQCGDNAYWTFDKNTGLLIISGNGDTYDYDYYDTPFGYNTSIKSIVIKNGITSIGKYIFYDCNKLKSVMIENGVEKITKAAFTGCNELEEISIPDSVTYIGEYAFSSCANLKTVIIPKNISCLNDKLFYNCKNLNRIIIPDNVESIGSRTFEGCTGLEDIVIGASVKNITEITFYGCYNLKSIVVDKNNSSFDSRENCNAIIKTSTNTLIRGCENTVIPNDVKSIGNYAFCDCKTLRNINLPSSVIEIGYASFNGCIRLDNIIIPSSVKSIGQSAFYGCTGMKNVYYSGTEAQWKKINIGGSNECLIGATIHFNYSPSVHSHYYFAVVTQPTCTEQGCTTYTCECGDSYVDNYVNALGHDYKAVETAPTCTEQGFTTYTCSRCHDSYKSNYVSAKGHTDGKWKITKKPTLTREGERTLYCKDCGQVIKTETIPKLTHGKVNGVKIDDISLNYKKSTTLKPQIDADDGVKYTVKYSSSNTKVATVDNNGKVTATKRGSGSATITCTVTDEYGNTVTDTCKVNVKLSFGQILITYILFGWIWY